MIAFYGRRDDEPLALAVKAAHDAGIDHLVIDQERLDDFDLNPTQGADGCGSRLRVNGREVPSAHITAVYARPLAARTASADRSSPSRCAAVHQEWLDWLDTADAFVVNRPCRMASNASKPYQAQLIARFGFLVPDTLITSDPDEVRLFRERHGRVVYKSVSGIRSVVRELTAADEPRLHLVRGLPTQFQAYVPGHDIRVHVVGRQTYAAQVTSGAIDYRYSVGDGGQTSLSRADLPDAVARRCVRLAAMLGLPFAGIDLRRRPDGSWVCFEVNTMPAYSYYEARAGLPISAALVRLLADVRLHTSTET